MILYYLDASAWVKRYYREAGTDWVQSLFSQNSMIACASLGLVEVTATLSRKRKAGEIPAELFEQKSQELEEDWNRLIQVQFTAEAVDAARKSARELALRGADAIHLASAVLLRGRLAEGDQLMLATSDSELKKAAQASGFAVIDPGEQDAQSAHNLRYGEHG
jgi:hypothetical protein